MKPYARAALLRIVRDKVLRMPGPRLSFTRP
jgi:hypothetical protein